jgi:hypothetical protein
MKPKLPSVKSHVRFPEAEPVYQALRILCGTIQAHRLNLGDPDWSPYAPPLEASLSQWLSQPESKLAGEGVAGIFRNALKDPPSISVGMTRRIAAVAEIMARARVFRSKHGKPEVDFIPDTTRLFKGRLVAIAKGIAAVNVHPQVTDTELQDTFRAALRGLPEYRRKLLTAILAGRDPGSAAMSRTVRRRELAELIALGILTKDFRFTARIAKLLSVARISINGRANE